jgi:cytochrome P450
MGTIAASETDLSDLDVFAGGAPWETFARLRRDAPVAWNPEPAPNHGFWSVTRHADIVAILRADQDFSSEKGAVSLEELDPRQLEIRKSMLDTDGTRHRALRRLLQRELTARALAGFDTFLRSLTASTLDAALAASGPFDFVRAVSADYPIRVLVRLLGIPDGFGDQIISWSNRLVGNTDPEYADVLLGSAESEKYRDLPFRSPAALEVFAYGDELARQRRGGSGTDLVSKLVNTVPSDGVPLSERDFHNYFLLLVAAGNETTRHSISHAMLALIQHPRALRRLAGQGDLLPVAVEEFLRWASPVYHFRRTALRDIELRGQQIRSGDKVVLWLASGNRDSGVFARADEFDITRSPNDHVTFGKGGPHFCMGSSLARLELQIMFEELVRRIDSIELAGQVEYVRSNFIHGIKRLPVRVTAR